jgi:hypothetical protein
MMPRGITRDYSHRLCYHDASIGRDGYRELCSALCSEYGLAPYGKPTEGLDEIFQDCRRGEGTVSLEWDIWVGFLIVAKDRESESVVRDMAEWIESGGCGATVGD